MTAANLLLWWQGALVWTALLIVIVMLLRRPVARAFGANAAYWLWALPFARLIMPALPGTPETAPLPQPALLLADPLQLGGSALMQASVVPAPDLADQFAAALPRLDTIALVWAIGGLALLTAGLAADRRYRRAILSGATPLDPIGSVRLLMSDAAEGPVAFGLLRRTIAVPRDFFLRYDAAERALALDHELAHHRGGDLWANAAALVLLAVQWFNPFAWAAWRAFRFDQEAACDARVLARAGAPAARTYAHAVAKTAVGRNFALAAPMASHNDVKERIRMMIDNPETPRRKLAGKLLLGGALVASLALTATVLPVTAQASEDPAPADAPAEMKREQHIIMINADGDNVAGDHAAPDGPEKRVHRIVINKDGDAGARKHVMVFTSDDDGPAGAPAADGEKRVIRINAGGIGLSAADIEKTLVEQGIDAAKAKDIAAKLEAQRASKMHDAMKGLHRDAAAIHAMHFASADTTNFAMSGCKEGGNGKFLVDRSSETDGKKTVVRMVRCTDGPLDKAQELAALKKARERLAADLSKQGGMSKDIRESVIADLDKSIADLEAK